MKDETQSAVIDWLATGSKGRSSECMAMWLAFGKRANDGAHPHDPDDLDRCLRLLCVATGLRRLLPKMAEVSPYWKALVERWDEIEQSHLDEAGLAWSKGRSAPKTYALMRSILDPVEASDRDCVRVGNLGLRIRKTGGRPK